jgi:hypothetical protein
VNVLRDLFDFFRMKNVDMNVSQMAHAHPRRALRAIYQYAAAVV